MIQREDALELSPDGYSRFFVIIQVLEQFYKNAKKPIRILDIGGCSPYLQNELKKASFEFELTILDILPKPQNIKAKYIQGDATKSDLPDAAFDVVVTTDTLEHIPKAGKDAFVKACVRLGKELCIIAAPFETPGVHAAEVMVNDFNKQLFGVGQDWLEEHFAFTKPEISQTKKVLDEAKVAYTHFGTNNLYSWVLTSHINLIEAKLGLPAKQSQAARRRYNKFLAESAEFDDPTYRHFFVISMNKRFKLDTLPAAFLKKQDPKVFAEFVHSFGSLLADRMIELGQKAEVAEEKVVTVKQQLRNEQIHSQKLQVVIGEQQAVLQRLEPVRRVLRFRHHPKRIIKALKKKITNNHE